MKLTRLIYFVSALIICQSTYGCGDSTSSPGSEQITSNPKPVGTPALGVPVPEMKLAADVRAYIRTVLAAPIPADYKLPADILAATDYNAAVALVGKHFPEFNGLEAEGLLAAVKKNPYRYQEMMLESRAVRQHYYPEYKH